MPAAPKAPPPKPKPKPKPKPPAPAVSAQAATAFWRGQVASQFNGTVETGDSRGCVLSSNISGIEMFSCTAYVRASDGSGQDVIGSVTANSQGGMSANPQPASGNQIQDWFAKTGGYNGP
jgi:hypothetical protein